MQRVTFNIYLKIDKLSAENLRYLGTRERYNAPEIRNLQTPRLRLLKNIITEKLEPE